MANVAQIHPAAPFASTANAYQLANLGQEIASAYAAIMQKIATSEVRHV